jgi:lysophospholipase L1-like esterase
MKEPIILPKNITPRGIAKGDVGLMNRDGVVTTVDTSGAETPIGGGAVTAESIIAAIPDDPAGVRAAVGVDPILIPNLVAAFDFARSNKLQKTGGMMALDGESVARINDAAGGPFYLEQVTTAGQYLRNGYTSTKPATPQGYVVNSLPMNFQKSSLVVIYSQRIDPAFGFENLTPWISLTPTAGVICAKTLDYLYGPARTGGSAWCDDAVNIKAFCNGTSETVSYNNNTAASVAPFSVGTGNLITLFAQQGSEATYNFKGNIRAAYLFDRKLTALEVSQIKAYHGIPIRTTALLTVGDSITQGIGATTAAKCWANLVRDSLGVSLINNGVSGQALLQRLTWTAAERGGVYQSGLSNVLVLSQGGNDLGIARTAAQVIADTETYCSDFKYLHPDVRIILCTLTPRTAATGFSGGTTLISFEAQRVLFNDWVRANYATVADGLADFGDSSVPLSDGVHPNDAGHAVIAVCVEAAINALP